MFLCAGAIAEQACGFVYGQSHHPGIASGQVFDEGFGAALAGLLWLVVRWVFFALALPAPDAPAFGRLPWPTLLLAGGLLAGFVLGALSRVVVKLAARRHAARAQKQLTRSVTAVADDLVFSPVAQVREDYLAAREALADAARR